ncbi:hypothetical protein OG905_08500 [Streptomyces sp. NBC_00322]|uniref:hypothetical protein n=1 Tax=Streptomyces sp. NBC_00322 TaxID=2975712 RepID=UPI002E2916BE|nr:hypothetical protein [Streptomyces sp. NBC_00322]
MDGALDVIAPGHPPADGHDRADDFHERLRRHRASAYTALGPPPAKDTRTFVYESHLHAIDLVRGGRTDDAARLLRALADAGSLRALPTFANEGDRRR